MLGSIGTAFLAPQGGVPAQVPAARDTLAFGAGTAGLTERWRAAFDPTIPPGWSTGWRLAEGLGPAAGPLLLELWKNESHAKLRHLYLGALAAADPVLLEQVLAEERTPRLPRDAEERFLGLLMLALGPSVAVEAPGLTTLSSRGGTPAVQVAALLASTRFLPGGRSWPKELAQHNDASVIAAALLAGAGEGVRLSRWVEAKRARDDQDLVLRAAFLAPHPIGAEEDLRIKEAARLFQRADAGAEELRRAAAFCLGGSIAPLEALRQPLMPPPPELLLPFCFLPNGRMAARRAGWLLAEPSLRLQPGERAALVVDYVLAGELDLLPAALEAWSGDPALGGAAALAISWRLLRTRATLAESLRAQLAPLPERTLVDFAAGAVVEFTPLALADPALERACALAVEGRLPRSALAGPIEGALWRRGAHPGLAARGIWFTLVRDLTLSGATYIAHRLGRRPAALPRGVEASDELMFHVAYEYFEWRLRTGEPDAPWRLR